jgi:uncharacterized tellurite resistance protein B-like protein
MIESIRRFFDSEVSPRAQARDERRRLEIATAALLVEVMRLDGAADAERDAVMRGIRSKFGMSAAEADELVALAEAEARDAVGFYQFTSLVNAHFSAPQKERIVELMWQVAYADEALSAHELHVIRKVADLLYVSHGAYIAAKLRAKNATSGSKL